MKKIVTCIILIVCLLSCTVVNAATVSKLESFSNELNEDVSVKFGTNSPATYDVLHVNGYPCISISDLATIIGGSYSGTTLKSSDGVAITYTDGSRLASFDSINVMMQCAATTYKNKLYVPVSSLENTLQYNVEYDRYGTIMDIMPFRAPITATKVVNVADYGAVGDGITDDRQAIIEAFYEATTSGEPAELKFEAGKTYRMSETMDQKYPFYMAGIQDFVFNGNGSTIIFDAPMTCIFYIGTCARISVKNITFDSKIPATTQGTITAVDSENKAFTVSADEGYPDLPSRSWLDATGGEYGFGHIIEAGKNYSKAIETNNVKIQYFVKNDNGSYKVYSSNETADIIDEISVNDRIVFIRDVTDYDLTNSSKTGYGNSNITVHNSGDIEFNNLTLKATSHIAAAGTNNWGRIKFDSFDIVSDSDEIYAASRDIIHFYDQRAGLIIENCSFDGALDDFINTKGTVLDFVDKIDNKKYLMNGGLGSRIGDEVIIYDQSGRNVLARRYITEIEWSNTESVNSEVATITLNKEVDGIITAKEVSNGGIPTKMYNSDTSLSGTVIRNNNFSNGRRHAYITRSANVLFANNNVSNMGGSMVHGANEYGTHNEGPFPSAITISNNTYTSANGGLGEILPISIMSTGASYGNTAPVDGVLIEGNNLTTPKSRMISVQDATDVYMYNNTLNFTGTVSDKTPIYFNNSVIKNPSGNILNYKGLQSDRYTVSDCEYSWYYMYKGFTLK